MSGLALGALALGAGVLGWELLVRAPSDVEVTRERLAFADLPGELDGMRIVFVSDLHHRRRAGFREGWVRSVVPRLEPDLILLGGDMVEHGRGTAPFLEMLGEWDPPLGIYAVFGNNEHRHADVRGMRGLMEARGVRVLQNQHVVARRGTERFVVAGCDDPHTYNDDLDRTLKGAPPGAFVLLLVHTPQRFPEAARRGVPLVFSGHTHGGQVRFPGIGALWCHTEGTGTRYQQGVYAEGASRLVLSKGVGTSVLPIRLFARPEVVLVELTRA